MSSFKQVPIRFLVEAWAAMGKPAFDPSEPDEVTAIRNTALVADESQLEMPIHIGETLQQFIESKSWNSPQPQQMQVIPLSQSTGSSGKQSTDKSIGPRLSLVTLGD